MESSADRTRSSQAWLQALGRDEVNWAAEDLLDALLDGEESEETHGADDLDQEVDVAVRPGLAASDRAEEGQGAAPTLRASGWAGDEDGCAGPRAELLEMLGIDGPAVE